MAATRAEKSARAWESAAGGSPRRASEVTVPPYLRDWIDRPEIPVRNPALITIAVYTVTAAR
jgi:hypothetical protein